MKATDVKVSTGPDAGNSLGIVTVSHFYPMDSGTALESMNSFTFDSEIERLQEIALERGATAVTGISFHADKLPGGLYVIATGTATKA